MSDARAHDRAHSIRGARTNFLTLVGQATFFLFGATAARLFGQAAWGAYTTAYAWIDVLARTSLLAGDKAALVFVPARRARGDEPGAVRAVGVTLRLALVTSSLCAVGMVLASYPIAATSDSPLDGEAMRLLAPVVVLSAVTMLLLAATMSAKVLRYNLLAKGVTEPIAMFALALVLGFTIPSLSGLALAPLLAGVAVLGIAVWGASRLFSLRGVIASMRRDRVERELVRFALPLALAEFLNILAMRLGSFVLIAYVAVSERAIFNTALLLAGTVSYIRGLFDTVMGPLVSEAWAHGDRERIARNLKSQSRMVLLLAVPYSSVFIVGGEAVLALYGPGFVDGHRTMIWLALGHVINASLGLTAWVLMAGNQTRSVLTNNIAKVVLELVLCVILIPPLGIEGAAISTAAAIAALHLLQIYDVWRFARVHPFSFGMLKLAALGGVIVGAELVAYHQLDGAAPVRALIALVAGTGLYFAVAWRWRERVERA